jgi:lipoprotein-anchoring transpeptidase ErfK/SrfK
MSRNKFVLAAMIAVLASTGMARAGIVIRVDKSAQEMTVTRDGEVVDRWRVSTGRRGYATPSGSFKPFRMEVDHHSDEWDDAPMPHSIFFTMQGHAIHGTYEAKHLGAAVSHGCVRISAAHATELFAMVKAEGMANTRVIVTGGAEDYVAKRRTPHAATDGFAASNSAYPQFGDAVEAPDNRMFVTPRY